MDGIVLIDKLQGITSNYLVQKIKKHIKKTFNENIKVGHTGTLDFFATGLMILTLGKATKLTQYFQGLDKEYIAVGELGRITDTYDVNGKVIEERKCNIEEEKLTQIIKSFEKTYLQYPPPYSAKRIEGKRAYQLAKEGITPQLKPKEVSIYKVEILDINLPFFKIKVHCSSGTYIRSLIKEIGDEAGCGAYTKELRRTKINGFSVENALPLEKFLKLEKEEIEKVVIPVEKSLPFLPKIILDEGFDFRFINGQRFKVNFVETTGITAVFSNTGKFLGIGKVDENKILHPETVFR
ncbi:tRNA pseudouridine(55) synthase TruB [Hydrogenivirga sp. 128-5-R1-1]|uniref:tRNA pseudouridine(55) synthase TruB n=1 Tax=Hydrogenivirga sp. 128-5-R1-1 TaxID=392423 RepID=UPI00015F1A29|nr:tRNA pseudouridine(55) synthase TruB [Hydrogenivirga sp. 128-5-R1-1]EDP74248.1 tRNA pseudouridine 55 synthase [Hydrogenivirga sp. 128-5-R1-1]